VAREKDLRKATERGGNLNRLAERQQGIRNDAQSLLEKIDKQDASRNGTEGKPNGKRDKNPQPGDKDGKSEKSDKKSGQDQDAKKKADADKNKQADASSKQGEGNSKGDAKDAKKKDADKKAKSDEARKSDAKGDEKQPPSDKSQSKGEKQSGDQKSQKGDSKKSQKQQGQGQQSPDGEEQQEQGEQQEGSPEQSQPQDQTTPKKTPGRKEIEEARRAMRQAEEELKRLDAKKGTEREDEAIRKLADARAQLEKILRQLREEEQQILLTSLEARFARMLLLQLQIHVDTIALSKTPTNAWTAKHFGRSRELSVAEDEIAVEAAKALTLLKEEGSSVAFTQGVEQVRDEMKIGGRPKAKKGKATMKRSSCSNWPNSRCCARCSFGSIAAPSRSAG
jgi:hypothetical protein